MTATTTIQTLDTIFAIEPDGFVAASQLAYQFGKGLIPIRQQGKLPAKTITIHAAGEMLEVHADAVRSGARVLLVGGKNALQRTHVASALRGHGLYVIEHTL